MYHRNHRESQTYFNSPDRYSSNNVRATGLAAIIFPLVLLGVNWAYQQWGVDAVTKIPQGCELRAMQMGELSDIENSVIIAEQAEVEQGVIMEQLLDRCDAVNTKFFSKPRY